MINYIVGILIYIGVMYFAQKGEYLISSILATAPIFTITNHYILASDNKDDKLGASVIFAIAAIIPLIIYYVLIYYLRNKINPKIIVIISSIIWLLLTGVLIYNWEYIYKMIKK